MRLRAIVWPILLGALCAFESAAQTTQTGPITYSGFSPLTGTLYFPVGGGALPSGDEPGASTPAAFTAVVSNFYVSLSSAPGAGNLIAFTWRDNTTAEPVTCTISGASAKSCSDLSHSFTATQGDLVDIQAVTTGNVAGIIRIVMTSQFGSILTLSVYNPAGMNQSTAHIVEGSAQLSSYAVTVALTGSAQFSAGAPNCTATDTDSAAAMQYNIGASSGTALHFNNLSGAGTDHFSFICMGQ